MDQKMMQDCCRLCSRSGGALINIFGEQGIIRNISEKINSRLQIFVNKEDILPKTICFSCYGKLDIFDAFVKSVHCTQTRLTKEASENCTSKRQSREINDRSKTTEGSDRIPGVTSYFFSNPSDKAGTSNLCNIKPPNNSGLPLPQKNADCRNPKPTVDQANERKPDFSNCSTKSFSTTGKEIIADEKETKAKTPRSLMKINTAKKTDSSDRKKSKFKRKYFELKPKHQRASNARIKRLPPVTSDVQSSALSPSNRVSKKVKSLKSPNERKMSNSEKKDFSTQAGNTLYSDLKTLKNSLLVKKIPVKNAQILTKRIHRRPSSTGFTNATNERGCQTQVLLGLKSTEKDKAAIHQKDSCWDAKTSQYITETLISPLNM